MAVLSAQSIKRAGVLKPCLDAYKDKAGNSAGLGPCGYDLTVDQDVMIWPGRFALASTVERFNLPDDVVAIVHDKSSLARRGLAVQNTVAEPGWRGHLTLELTCHGRDPITLRKGDAVAQAIFHRLDEPTDRPYAGKYQDQERGPQESR
jgi:dCTP deaminase